jgi:hypothetical protein
MILEVHGEQTAKLFKSRLRIAIDVTAPGSKKDAIHNFTITQARRVNKKKDSREVFS